MNESLHYIFKTVLGGIDLSTQPYWYLDILLIVLTIYYLLKYIKGSRASQIMIGLLLILFIYVLARELQLKAVVWIMQYLFAGMVIAIPIVFQDEIRRALEKLGQMKISRKHKHPYLNPTIQAISEACRQMATKKIGALIVIKKNVSLRDYIETGAQLNANVSKALLLNIFTPNAPLHDGAVIIENDKIISAGAVLPISQQTYDINLGTRHKSALGLSEQTDAVIIVVSEERGIISLAQEGSLTPQLSVDNLSRELSRRIYDINKKQIQKRRGKEFRAQTERI